MQLEGRLNSNYELVSQLRHTIRVRKIRNNVMRVSWLTVGALVLYTLADYGIPIILKFHH
jgi:hypothetical protein